MEVPEDDEGASASSALAGPLALQKELYYDKKFDYKVKAWEGASLDHPSSGCGSLDRGIGAALVRRKPGASLEHQEGAALVRPESPTSLDSASAEDEVQGVSALAGPRSLNSAPASGNPNGFVMCVH